MYTISRGQENISFQTNLEFMQGVYGAQLFAAIHAYYNDDGFALSRIGSLPTENEGWGFDMKRLDTDIQSYAHENQIYSFHEWLTLTKNGNYEDVSHRLMKPTEEVAAYNLLLSEPLTFIPQLWEMKNLPLNIDFLPYRTTANFNYDPFRGRLYGQINENTPVSFPASKYYIGTTSDGRNTFMFSIDNLSNKFLQGFMWLLREVSIFNSIPLPDLYLYTYNQPTIVRPTTNNDAMEKQLPNVTTLLLSNR